MEERPEPTGAREEADESRPAMPADVGEALRLLISVAMGLARSREAREREEEQAFRLREREERRRRREPQPVPVNLRRLHQMAQVLADDVDVISEAMAEVERRIGFLQHDCELLQRWLRRYGEPDPLE